MPVLISVDLLYTRSSLKFIQLASPRLFIYQFYSIVTDKALFGLVKLLPTGFSKHAHLSILLHCHGQKYCSALSNCIQPASPGMFSCQFLWMQHRLASTNLIKILFQQCVIFKFWPFLSLV